MTVTAGPSKTKCDRCGRSTTAARYDPYFWRKLTVSGMGYDPNDQSFSITRELDLCPDCFGYPGCTGPFPDFMANKRVEPTK